MITQTHNVAKNSANFTRMETGALIDWIDNRVDIPGLGLVQGKLFLKEYLGFTSMEMSINALPPNESMPFLHTHRQNEEVYFFIHGKGQFQVDGENFDVCEGSIVRISPKGERTWRNNGSEMLVFLVMQMKANSLHQWGINDGDVVPNKPVVWPM